jgi:hypothetical protein
LLVRAEHEFTRESSETPCDFFPQFSLFYHNTALNSPTHRCVLSIWWISSVKRQTVAANFLSYINTDSRLAVWEVVEIETIDVLETAWWCGAT